MLILSSISDILYFILSIKIWSTLLFYIFLGAMVLTILSYLTPHTKKLFNHFNLEYLPFALTQDTKSVIIQIASLCLGIFTMILIVSIRFAAMPTPQGYDTGIYIYNIQKLENGIVIPILLSTKGISYLILWLSYRLFSYGNWVMVSIMFPYVAGFVFVVLVWATTKIGYDDSFLLFVIPVVSVMSYYFIRVSYDLYSQTIGLGILYLLLVYLGKSYSEKITKKSIFFKGLLLALLFLAHFYTAILTTAFVILIEMYRVINMSRTERKTIDLKTLTLIILGMTGVIGGFAILKWSSIYWILTTVIPNEFRFFGVTPDSFWFAYNEFPLIWLSAIFGILVMHKRQNPVDKILLRWCYFIIGVIFITGYAQIYRLLLLLPLAFYSGVGVEYITSFITSPKSWKKFLNITPSDKKRKIIATLFVLSFLLIIGNNAVSRAYIPQYVYYPNTEAFNQILWIYNEYGFSNDNIIVPIYKPTAESVSSKSSANIYTWAKAYLGDCIYLGSLIDLLNGIPDVYGNTFDIDNKTILLADKLYTLELLDYLFAMKINEIGIYKVVNTNISTVESILFKRQKWIDNKFIDFYDNWRIISRSLPTKIITRESSLILNFSSNAKRGWFTIEHYFITPFNTSDLVALAFKIRGNIETEKMYIEFYSEKGAFKSAKYTQLYDHYILAIIYLPPNYNLNHIRIAIKKLAPSTAYEFVEFQYIMLF